MWHPGRAASPHPHLAGRIGGQGELRSQDFGRLGWKAMANVWPMAVMVTRYGDRNGYRVGICGTSLSDFQQIWGTTMIYHRLFFPHLCYVLWRFTWMFAKVGDFAGSVGIRQIRWRVMMWVCLGHPPIPMDCRWVFPKSKLTFEGKTQFSDIRMCCNLDAMAAGSEVSVGTCFRVHQYIYIYICYIYIYIISILMLDGQ